MKFLSLGALALGFAALYVFLGYQVLFKAPKPLDAVSQFATVSEADSFCVRSILDGAPTTRAWVTTHSQSGTKHWDLELTTEGRSWLVSDNWVIESVRPASDEEASCADEPQFTSGMSAVQSALSLFHLPYAPAMPATIQISR